LGGCKKWLESNRKKLVTKNNRIQTTIKNKKMKILIFHQYFSTNKGAYGTRLYEFCRNWVAAGHEVTVVTSVYYKSDLKGSSIGTEMNVEGIRVHVMDMPISNKDNFLKRIYYFMMYSILATKYAIREEYDVVMASSGPISTGIPALLGKWFRKKKMVFEVRDLWPGVVEEIGVISNRLVLGFSYWFEKLLYNNSDLIVALSPGMVANIEQRYGKMNIISITNAANLELFERKTHINVEDTFAIYVGNIGQVNNSNLILEAAKELIGRGRHDVKIKMIGDGQLYLEILGRVKMEGISNLEVRKAIPKKEVVANLHRAFVSLIPLLDKPLLDTSSPNKLFESLAAGTPVIQTTNGWIKSLLEDSGAGFTVSPSCPKDLANRLEELHDNPKLKEKMGAAARQLAVNLFDNRKLASEMLVHISELVAHKPQAQ
jgi:glycosyltransferase involved in cell wall biosynthesis